jgi:hypothetical protein
MATLAFGKSARTKKAEPVSRWQSWQWHARTLMGAPLATYFTAPQKQPPVLFTDADFVWSLMSRAILTTISDGFKTPHLIVTASFPLAVFHHVVQFLNAGQS